MLVCSFNKCTHHVVEKMPVRCLCTRGPQPQGVLYCIQVFLVRSRCYSYLNAQIWIMVPAVRILVWEVFAMEPVLVVILIFIWVKNCPSRTVSCCSLLKFEGQK